MRERGKGERGGKEGRDVLYIAQSETRASGAAAIGFVSYEEMGCGGKMWMVCLGRGMGGLFSYRPLQSYLSTVSPVRYNQKHLQMIFEKKKPEKKQEKNKKRGRKREHTPPHSQHSPRNCRPPSLSTDTSDRGRWSMLQSPCY